MVYNTRVGKSLDTFISVISVFSICWFQTTAVQSATVHGPLLKRIFSPEGDGLCSLHKKKALHTEKPLSHKTAANSDLVWIEREEKPVLGEGCAMR